MVTLHYIYDLLCGWCYAAESLIEAAARIENVQIVLHGGGLFPSAMHLPAAKCEYIRLADARIGQMSGQVFGDAYLNGLLADPSTVYDSRPPITAMLAARMMRPDSSLAMLKTLQHAHYRAGRRIVELPVLADLAASIGLEREIFLKIYADCAGACTDLHIRESREMMQRLGASGFPAFFLERDGAYQALRHETCYGQPSMFAEMLSGHMHR